MIPTYYRTRSVVDVAFAVSMDMQAQGRTTSILENYNSPISKDQYRIAIRVNTTVKNIDDWDYHFMVQTSDGGWAEKHGPGGVAVYHPEENPYSISWDCGSNVGFYDSSIVFLAISKKGG